MEHLLFICESFVIIKKSEGHAVGVKTCWRLTPLFLSDDIIDGIDKNLVLVLLLFCEVVEGHDVGM